MKPRDAIRDFRGRVRACGIRDVLVVTSNLGDFSGPSLIAADLAAVFRAAGAAVTVAGWRASDAYVGAVPHLAGAVSLGLDPRAVMGRHYDLVIAHGWQSACFALLECGVRFRHLVCCSFSSFATGEAILGLEAQADALMFASAEVEEAQRASLRHCPAPRIDYRNALPAAWYREAARPGPLRRAAVVTNHLCPEVAECVALARQYGIDVDVIGRGGTPELVDAAVIDRYDAIMTIGHTVQKAMARGVPVFCYDHFGGPGWITPDNAAQAEATHFSGRPSTRRGAAQLLDEFRSGHPRALAEAPTLRRLAASRYMTEERLATLLAGLPAGATHRDFLGPEFWNFRKIFQYALGTHRKADLFPRGYMLAPPSAPACRVIAVEMLPADVIDASVTTPSPLAMVGATGAEVVARGRLRQVGTLEAVAVVTRFDPGGATVAHAARVTHARASNRGQAAMTTVDFAVPVAVPPSCETVTLVLRSGGEADATDMPFARLTLAP